MRLKYYLRGLGIGVAVTVLVLGGVPGKQQTMTDAQVKARAAELGMVEKEGVLSSLADETEAGTEAGTETEGGGETSQAEEETTEDVKAETDPASSEETAEAGEKPESVPETEEETENKPEPGDKPDEAGQKPVVIEESIKMVAIYPGEGSYTVSKKLAASGLVESADIYDNYLCQNGYDKKLCSGNYEIPVGASPEEIAKILTKQQ